MPTYDYRCPNGHDFEHFYRKISDASAELACPQCGAMATRRVSGGAGLVFKGSGFYLTDYGKNAHRTAGPEGTSAGAESKADSSADSKPAANADSAKGDSTKSGSASTASAKPDTGKSSETKSSKPKSGESK